MLLNYLGLTVGLSCVIILLRLAYDVAVHRPNRSDSYYHVPRTY